LFSISLTIIIVKMGKKEVIPPLDFTSLVLPFYTKAMEALGEVGESNEVNLELACRLIDLLDLLAEKTRGNLKKEEEEFLNSITAQLKILYFKRSKGDED